MNNYNQEYDRADNMGNVYGRNVDMQRIMTKTALYMVGVLLISALSAWYTVQSESLLVSLYSGGYLVLLIAELIVVWAAGAAIKKLNTTLSRVLLVVYSVINGMTLGCILFLYTTESVVAAFITSAAVFGVMALFGLFTKRDLTSLGTIGYIGLIALFVVGIVNIFLQSSGLSIIYSAVSVALFLGITAYDVNKIKRMAYSGRIQNESTIAMFGALNLYLDFINIFLNLLRLFGSKRR